MPQPDPGDGLDPADLAAVGTLVGALVATSGTEGAYQLYPEYRAALAALAAMLPPMVAGLAANARAQAMLGGQARLMPRAPTPDEIDRALVDLLDAEAPPLVIPDGNCAYCNTTAEICDRLGRESDGRRAGCCDGCDSDDGASHNPIG